MESVETSGKTVEDAIVQALARLGRTRDQVEVTVLQEPSRGARGMGVRDARVRVFVKPEYVGIVAPGAANGGDYAEDTEAGGEYEVDGEYGDEFGAEDDYEESGAQRLSQELTTAVLADVMPEDATGEEVAIEALRMILGHMGVQATVEVVPAHGEEPLRLNVQSLTDQPLSLLIGRRGETLAALQFIVNMIVTQQGRHRERVIVDVQDYRARREANLRQMAFRVADQVRRSGAPVALEAMPPNERRIIHMALSETDDISTESAGEGEQRRVVVSLRR